MGVSDPQAVTLGGSNGEHAGDDADSQAVEATAAKYPRSAIRARSGRPRRRIDATSRTEERCRSDAAQLIASGVADHDAQRLLVDVVRTLGKRDVAKAKCQLLVQALRLDGREDLAAEVEQLALAD